MVIFFVTTLPFVCRECKRFGTPKPIFLLKLQFLIKSQAAVVAGRIDFHLGFGLFVGHAKKRQHYPQFITRNGLLVHVLKLQPERLAIFQPLFQEFPVVTRIGKMRLL